MIEMGMGGIAAVLIGALFLLLALGVWIAPALMAVGPAQRLAAERTRVLLPSFAMPSEPPIGQEMVAPELPVSRVESPIRLIGPGPSRL